MAKDIFHEIVKNALKKKIHQYESIILEIFAIAGVLIVDATCNFFS